MLTSKRVLVATLCGVLFGFLCMYLASSNPDPAQTLSTAMLATIVVSRTMMGFAIGISAIPLRWWAHGPLLGIISSIPMALPVLERPAVAIGTIVLGMIYGLLTDLITTVVFKSPGVGVMRKEAVMA